MIPAVLLLETIKAVAQCVTELVKFWQTPEGQAGFAQMRADRTAWDSFWKETASGVKDFFKSLEIGQ